MPVYTVAQTFPAGTTRNWTNQQTGETIVYHNHNVQFVELPGQTFQLGRSAKQKPLAPGQQITGSIQQGNNGNSFFKEEKPAFNGRPGGGGGQRFGGGGNSTGKEIMAQTALKAAVEMAIAAQKFDPQSVDFYASAYMETLLKTSGLRVEAQAPPQQPQAAPQPMAQPQNGYAFQAPPQQQHFAAPQQFAQPQQQYSTDDVPF